jgi:HAE1 family hydrophobic/amphiphilic exporter-1
METAVTKPVEEAVNTVAGIDELRSTTREGFSQVVVAFKLEKNGDVAATEVDSKVRTILGQLPVGTDPPIIDKLAIDAAPVLTISVSGRRDMREITEIARKKLKEDLESLPGVGSVVLVGGRPRAIHVIVDPDKLQKYENLTVEDIRQALVRENREDPGGRVDRRQSELGVRVIGRVERMAYFNQLIVANRNGQAVRVEDIGRAEDGFEEPRGVSRLWVRGDNAVDEPGENAVSLVIQKQSGKNTVAVVDEVRKRLAEITPTLPPDIRTQVIRDQSRFIRSSMEEVKTHLLLAVVLVSLSVLLFLRDWRATLIATLAIPTSMVGAFAFMDLMGFSLNTFTLIGMILAVGVVVEHLPAHGGAQPEPVAGGEHGDEGDRARGPRDDVVAGGDLRPDRVHGRPGRAVL